ncbi:MAG: CRISPR-associated endonuclease Cas2 [Pyrinomonadaceae bacterium]
MLVLICYDVSTIDSAGRKRLRKIARACADYGQRVQNSIFECKITKAHWVLLKSRLLREFDIEQDSLRFYFLDSDINIEHHGTKEPIDLEKPLIL